MVDKYLVVNTKVLPDVYEKVVEAKELMYRGEAKDISECVKKVGISRSTYYKYKDYVFFLSEAAKGRKITLGLLVEHKAGVLSEILDKIAEKQGNILTINQDIPINEAANVSITFNMENIKLPIDRLIDEISKIKNVIKVRIIAME